ncbi:MAG: hypothetical protein AAFQ37_08810, partial [Bacteroidota bacterium]
AILNPCDLSINTNAAAGCYSFIRSSDGTGSTNRCGAFIQTLNVEIVEVPDILSVSADQSLDCGDAVMPLTVSTTGSVIHWESNTTSCGAQDWEVIPNSASNSYTPPFPSSTTYYRAVLEGIAVNCQTGNCELVSECIIVSVPDSCTSPCVIEVSAPTGINLKCQDNGTLTDASEDRILFRLNPEATNGGVGYTIVVTEDGSGNVVTATPQGGFSSPFGYGVVTTFLLPEGTAGSGNSYTVVLTDAVDSGCTATVNFADPGSCSPNCEITPALVNVGACNPADGTYELTVELTYQSAVGNATVTLGTGESQSFTLDGISPDQVILTGLLSNGTAGITITASSQTTDGEVCTGEASTTYNAPVACSPCSITGEAVASDCQDNGTPSDAADDTFFLSVSATLSGITDSTYNAFYNDGNGPVAFPDNPYPSEDVASVELPSDGTSYTITVEDSADAGCNANLGMITAPTSCSDQCNFDIMKLDASVCTDNTYDLRIVLGYQNPTDPNISIFVDGALAGTYVLGTNVIAPGVDSFIISNPAALICGQGIVSFSVEVGIDPDCEADDQFMSAPIDPAGYVYCIDNGAIVQGGLVEVTQPDGTSGTEDFGNVNFGDRQDDMGNTIPNNGLRGTYNWEVTVPGVYTQSYLPPPGFTLATGDYAPQPTTLDPTGENDPFVIGSDASGDGVDSTLLLDFSAASNIYYQSFDLDVGDPFVINNNIPLMSSSDITAV